MTVADVDAYLAAAPEPHRSTLVTLRDLLRSLLPTAVESLSYGVPAFKVGGKAVAGYAHFARHCSYFPHSGSVLPQLEDELHDYVWSKGTLKFAPHTSLPPALVALLVATRLEELGLDGLPPE